MIFTDLLIIAFLAYAAYAGTKRGLVLIGLELGSFVIATAVALLVYRPAGELLKSSAGIATGLANVAAFTVVWVIIEISCAMIARHTIIPKLSHRVHQSLPNRAGGAVLNALKSIIIVVLALVVFAGLPLSAAAKGVVTGSYLSKALLSSSGTLQQALATGLGRDLGDSLNFFTVTAEPHSDQRVELGFTTTKVKVDPIEEEAMLKLLNKERTKRGLHALTTNKPARAVARKYSADMFARGYFSHINPEGKTPFDRMRAGKVIFGTAGENLALAPTLTLAHQGLMNSPGHRANILSTKYRAVGIGIVDGGPYGLMVTQNFTD